MGEPGFCRSPHPYTSLVEEARTTLNGGGDNNVDYLRRSPGPHYSEWIMARPEERFHKFGGYCFYVVE